MIRKNVSQVLHGLVLLSVQSKSSKLPKSAKTRFALLFTLCVMSVLYSCNENDDLEEYGSLYTYEAEEVSGYGAILSASIPLAYKNDFDFEISKEPSMGELIHYNVTKQIHLPNSLENNILIKTTIDDLDPCTEYFYRIAVSNQLTGEKKYGETYSFKTCEPSQSELSVGKARLSDTNNYLNGFNVNLLLTSGTVSGEVEKHNVLRASLDRENKERNVTNPSIKVWEKGLSGKIFAYYVKYNDTEGATYSHGSDYPKAQDSNNIMYFKEIPWGNLYAGYTDSFNSDIILKPTMAEINVTVVGCGENSMVPIYVMSNDRSKSVFYAGWVDLTTGQWTKDEEESKGKWSRLVYGYTNDDSGTIRRRKFFYPPSEFEKDEISISAGSSLSAISLPKTKWEAGQVYEYRITF